jgi:hypothetical protein
MKTIKLVSMLAFTFFMMNVNAQGQGETVAGLEEKALLGKFVDHNMTSFVIIASEDLQRIQNILLHEDYLENEKEIKGKLKGTQPYFALMTNKGRYDLKNMKFEKGTILTMYTRKYSGDVLIPKNMFFPSETFNGKETIRVGNSKATVSLKTKGEVSLIFM